MGWVVELIDCLPERDKTRFPWLHNFLALNFRRVGTRGDFWAPIEQKL